MKGQGLRPKGWAWPKALIPGTAHGPWAYVIDAAAYSS